MTEEAVGLMPESAQPLPGLASRAIGVFTSPKALFEKLARNPKIAGMLVLVTLLGSLLGPGIFMMTDKGKQAWLDTAIQQSERRSNQPVTDQQQQTLQKISQFVGISAVGGSLVVFPVVLLIEAGVLYLIFTFGTGGTATFKQVMAVVTHTGMIGVLGVIFTTVMIFVQGTLPTTGVSPANLGALLPMLEPSWLTRFIGMIDLFRVWAFITLSIGLSVVYRKKTSTIAIIVFSIYFVIIAGIAAIFT